MRTAPAHNPTAVRADYDAEIAKVETDIEAFKPQMQKALEAWLDATAPWVAERWRETLEVAIAYSPDAVKALGDERRRALKERTTEMIDAPRPYVEKRLVEERPEAWPHLRADAARWDVGENFTTQSNRVGGKVLQTLPDGVSSTLEGVLSEMADLLEQEGFDLARFLPGSPRSRSQRTRVAEGTSLDWSDEMMRTMNLYGQLTNAYVAGLKELEKVQSQRARSEAEELWGNA